jgi:pectate lyase
MLFGASDGYGGDEKMQITVAFNHFGKRLIQRMPRCRFGFIHVLNNDYTHWEMYAIGGSMHPTIISEGNRFIAPDNGNAKEVCNSYNCTSVIPYKILFWSFIVLIIVMIKQKHRNKLKFMITKSRIIFCFGVDEDNKEGVRG